MMLLAMHQPHLSTALAGWMRMRLLHHSGAFIKGTAQARRTPPALRSCRRLLTVKLHSSDAHNRVRAAAGVDASMHRRALPGRIALSGVVSQRGAGEQRTRRFSAVLGCITLRRSPSRAFRRICSGPRWEVERQRLLDEAVQVHLTLRQLSTGTHPVLAAPEDERPRIRLLSWILHLFHMRALLPLHQPQQHFTEWQCPVRNATNIVDNGGCLVENTTDAMAARGTRCRTSHSVNSHSYPPSLCHRSA